MEQVTISKRRRHAIANGYRSGLEEIVSRQIEDAGLTVQYEQDKIEYVWPERTSTYTPDFKLPKKGGFFFVETKGRWDVSDRQKHLLIKQQHPDIDIRFVFSNQIVYMAFLIRKPFKKVASTSQGNTFSRTSRKLRSMQMQTRYWNFTVSKKWQAKIC